MRQVIFSIVLLPFLFGSCNNQQPTSTSNKSNSQKIEEKIDSLLAEMTLAEKVKMIHASSSFTSGGIERLGIPEIIYSDGPHGVRREHGRDWEIDKNVYDSSTYLPVGISLASTWNPDLGYKFGQVLGSEARFRGKDVILGPGLNIIRSPLNGRNFEYLTEDPYLNAQFVRGYVKGVQENGVAACAKHYIANTLEFQREQVDVQMSERALREIYLPGFKAAVEEDVFTIMAAYNKFRGEYCAHSTYLLDTILKNEFGFEGILVSDWNAVKNTEKAAKAGVDVEMGTDLMMLGKGLPLNYGKFFLGDTLIKLVEAGAIDQSFIDSKVERILKVMFKIGIFDENRPTGEYNTKAHQATAKAIADEAIILLKNEENLLPLSKEKIKKIAVIGANANRKQAGGGGSSQVKAYYEITPLQGLKNLLGKQVEISFGEGYEITRDNSVNIKLRQEALEIAKDADAVIYVGGWIHGYSDEWNDNAYDAEIIDKVSMILPFGQNELIEGILSTNPNTVVVMVGGGPVDMTTWLDQTKALIQAWYPGMEGGNSIAQVIFGEVNPSGKLPIALPKKLEDSPAHSLAQYPDENLIIDHKEGVFVGYRYFDTYGITPEFPFGHGLSYTTFKFNNLEVTKNQNGVAVSVEITNTGKVAGKEVVQVYVADNEAAVKRPTKELKGFKKVNLQPGETKQLAINLEKEAFMYFDEDQNKWVLENGAFEILVGNSSTNILVSKAIEW